MRTIIIKHPFYSEAALSTIRCLFFLFALKSFAHNPLDWQFKFMPAPRQVNSVWILSDNTIVIAGGNERNDSIRSVYRTSDYGDTWDYVLDIPGQTWIKGMYFVNASAGYAVGNGGLIMKSSDGGHSWTVQNVPGSVSTRNFNSIYFIDSLIGYVVGGNQKNDSIQTILKTTDGGNNWTLQRDGLGYWLKSVYFSTIDRGYAVGEHGVALRTTDGGNNWTQASLPGNVPDRDLNTVYFLNSSIGFIGGGNKINDSIQTIIKTTDGGDSWNIISDKISPWITSIYFPTSAAGFAVGDKGTVLLTEDAGDSWNQVVIPNTVNDTLGLYSVYFLNADFGVAAGRYGKFLVYKSTVPTVPEAKGDDVTNIGTGSATLNGRVNANGFSSFVTFEYDTTLLFGHSIAATPDSVTGNAFTSVRADVEGLNPDHLYYFRVKAYSINGASYSPVKQFYVGNNPIPNWDFELWDTVTANVPQEWRHFGDVSQIISYDGSYGVALAATESGSAGGVAFIIPSDIGLFGGVPFAARPDSIIGHFKYDVAQDDSAVIILFLKKNGNFNSQNFFYITGSSNGNFERLSFPIAYSDTIVPDSMILGVVNSIPFYDNSTDTSSKVSLDNISFSGTSVNVPNNDFEDWHVVSSEYPASWLSSAVDKDPVGTIPALVSKTSDSRHGDFAARLQNRTVDNIRTAGITLSDYNVPAFPVNSRFSTFNGYLKYFPENSDTLEIRVDMYENSLQVGTANLNIDSTIADYTSFSIPIIYTGPDAQTLIPDSASIFISAGRGQGHPHGSSVLYIDALSFDGFYSNDIDTGTQTVVKPLENNLSWSLYPNPAQNNVVIKIKGYEREKLKFSIFDLRGNPVYAIPVEMPEGGDVEFSVDVKNFSSGGYIAAVQDKGGFQFKKMIISNWTRNGK